MRVAHVCMAMAVRCVSVLNWSSVERLNLVLLPSHSLIKTKFSALEYISFRIKYINPQHVIYCKENCWRRRTSVLSKCDAKNYTHTLCCTSSHADYAISDWDGKNFRWLFHGKFIFIGILICVVHHSISIPNRVAVITCIYLISLSTLHIVRKFCECVVARAVVYSYRNENSTMKKRKKKKKKSNRHVWDV